MAENLTDWPYDADRDDPLTALRIPVTSAWPGWAYIVSFDGAREIGSPARPTDAEAAMLVSFLEHYIDYWYNESFKAKLKARPFDIDGGANGVTFHKYGDNDWAYRRRSWSMGPTFVPSWDRKEPLTLEQVMDRAHTFVDEVSPRWLEWKAAHPEVFGEKTHA